MVNWCVSLVSFPPPLSWAVTETVAEPKALGAGVKVSVPPEEIAGWTENSASLLLLTWKLTVWPASLGPAEMAVAHAALYAPESSFTVTSPPATKLGGSLTGMTVMLTSAVSVPPLPSEAV